MLDWSSGLITKRVACLSGVFLELIACFLRGAIKHLQRIGDLLSTATEGRQISALATNLLRWRKMRQRQALVLVGLEVSEVVL
jgi:hypothetical protein